MILGDSEELRIGSNHLENEEFKNPGRLGSIPTQVFRLWASFFFDNLP